MVKCCGRVVWVCLDYDMYFREVGLDFVDDYWEDRDCLMGGMGVVWV